MKNKHSFFQSIVQSKARWLFTLFTLLTLGVGNAWAGHGFFSDGAAGLKIYYTGDSDTEIIKNSTGASTEALGIVTSLYLKGWWFAAWENSDDFNGSETGTFYYRIYLSGSPSGSYTSNSKDYYNWGGWNNGSQNVWLGRDDMNVDLLSGLVGGNYIFEYYYNFSAQGNLNNGESYYKVSFTYDPKFTVTVAAGSNGSVASTSVTAGNIDAVTLPTASANTGYHFNNWTTESSDLTLGNTTSATTGTVKARAAGTVTANFVENTYSLTFANTDGHGTVSVGGSQVAAAGSSGSASVNHFTTKALVATPNTGYNFSSWTVSGTNSSAVTIGSTSTASTTIKATNTGATVTASFTPKTTTITLNKGEHGASNQTATVSYDATALTSISHVAADGMYELTGYFTDGGVKVLNADGSFAGSTVTGYITSDKWSNANAAVTLYAHWDAVSTYTVSYNAGGGTGSMSSNTGITAGGSQTISANTFTRSGYTFSHWTADVDVTANNVAVAAGGTIAAGATLSGINSNIALTAHWTENDYTVTVNAGSNGTVASSSVTGHMDTKVTLPTATANTGYHFSTWTTVTGTVSYDNQTSATAAKVYGLSAAATVRADFTANTYSVVFNANGGTGSMSNEAFTYDASKALTSNSFTRSGYTFLGWATSTELAAALTVNYTDGQSVSNLTSANEGTFTLYAVWAKKYYIGGRFQHDWEDGSSTTNEMTYVSDGRYKFETNKTVNELSVQWHNVSGNYDANQVFFIHTGSGKSGSSSNPFYTTPNEDGAGLNFETSNAYANALVLANQETTWGSIVNNRCVQFSNTDNLSSAVIIWWEPSTKKIWYTATESLNTNYYLLGFGEGSWSETDARRFKVDEVNATTATVSVALTAQTYTANTDDGFKVKNGSTYYGNNNTMTRANCSGWVFETDKNNCGITADVAGTYTFELNLSTMAVSVTFPTAYTLTYDIGTIKGTNGTISSSPSTASGSLVLNGTSITLTAPSAMTGYSWKGWYDNAAGTGEALHSQQAYTFTVDDNTALYACYNETTYAVTLNNGDHGTVSPSGSTQIGATGVEVTATPAAGWKFNGWTKTGTYVTLSSETANPTTVTAAGTGSVTPTYIQRYILRGSLKDNSDNAGMAGWSATDNSAYTSSVIAGNVMTVTATLTKSKTDYKFKIFDLTSEAWRGQTGSDGYIPAATNWTLNGGNDVYFRATAIGTYTFAVDFTTADAPAVTVTRPTGFPVNYGFGTIEGASSAPTAQTAASITVNSGDSVQSGTSVTLTASAAKTGYTWQGWYTTNNTSGTKLSENLTYTTTVSAATTVYAVYTENLYTVTVTAGDNGSISVGSPSVQAGIDTNPTITATANTGYRFSYWEVVRGTATFANDRAATTTVSASSDATIRAVFGSNWVIGGSTATFGNWVMENGFSFANFETVDGKEIGYVNLELPANSEFEVKVYDHNTGGWYGHGTTMETVTYTSNNGTALLFETGNDKENLKIITAGHGLYQFVWNQTDHQLTVNYPTSYTITYGQKTYYGVDESSDATTTGGTFTVVDGDENALPSGNYIVGTDAAVFTAVPATNYSLAGWYKDSEFTNAYVNGEDGAVITTNTLALTPTVNSNVYAKFAENMTTVAIAHNTHGHVELGGARVTSIRTGAITTRSITAVPDVGYYFAGWTITEGSDFTPSATGEANTTITVTGNGTGATSGQTLTANFVELDKVYFRNIFDDGENEPTSWENVYVYFDAYWDSGELGAGAKDKPYALMTQVGTSNVYVAYIPRSITAANKKAVAFSNVDFHTYENFHGSKAVYRTDYSSILNMFVPYHTSSETKNTTEYFSNGYWMQYETVLNESAGYYLKKRTGTNTYEEKGYFAAMTDNATTIQYKLYINEEGTGNNKYRITSAGGLNYVAASQITSANYRDIELNENNTSDSYFEIMPTSEGYYTLQINQEGDKMKLTVIYPISVGDHRLKNTFTVDEETKYTYSDIIKSDVSEQKVSMYINNKTAASPSLKLQKCTGLTAGVATWDDGTTVTMTGITTDTMGVYVFDLAVSGDAGTISNAAPYKGSYYLKTDLAPGAWINYQQNAMQLNTNTFNKNKATTFDYYSCFWCGSAGTNIKCVVANEYCNQLSDTLFGDAIIGVGAQTMPAEGNIRFSYNSTTNEVKRSYINGSAYWEDQFLLLSGSPKMVDKDTRSTFTNNKTTFVDMNNWTYQKDVACYANANVILTAQFNGQTQLLLGSTNNTDSVQLIGGSGSTLYNMRLVYDFKTDYLISGLLAGNTNYDESQAIFSDVIIIRGGQNNAQQLTFGTDKALTEVKTVYGVMQFEKSTITNSSLSRYLRNTYWVSFPFDVNLNDVVGFGTYGKHWIIQYYDGAARAAHGLWADSPSYWKRVTAAEREAGFTLKANMGYLLSLSLNNMAAESSIWDNSVTTVSLYFPSKEPVATINGELPEAGTFVVPAHPVTFAGSERDGRYYKDANWNLIGVPSYANIAKTVSGSTKIMEYDMPFLYTHNTTTNAMVIEEASDVTFGAMKAYLVQYAGTINWRLTTIPAGVAARRNADAPKDTYTLCLRLNQEGQTIDKTFISFNDEMTTGLDINKDLTKAFNSNINNIYTICDDVELGAQFLPLGDESVYIPVGIDAAYNGTVELCMPNGTDGLEVYLFDRETQKHTNMLTSTYTVDLTQGINDDRFLLEVRRPQMPTDIMTTGSVEDETTKYMQNGHLYIKKGQNVYNAEGKRVNNAQ